MATHPTTANGLPRPPVALESRVDASGGPLQPLQASTPSFPGPSPTPSPAAAPAATDPASQKLPAPQMLTRPALDTAKVAEVPVSRPETVKIEPNPVEPKIESASAEPITESMTETKPPAASEPRSSESTPLIRLKLNAAAPPDSKAKPAARTPTKPRRKSAKAKATAADGTVKAAKGKSTGKAGAAKKKPKVPKPKMIVKVRYANKAPMPEFEPVVWDTPKQVFWTRVSLREFFLRFDKLCRLPTRHSATLNNPFEQWNDMLYKAAIVALLRLVKNDSQPIIAYGAHYLGEIEHTPAESPTIWELLYELLEQCDPYLHKVDDMTGDMYRLELVRRLMVFCTGTETIRITVVSDIDEVKHLQVETADKIKALQNRYLETAGKLEKLRSTDERLYEDRLAAAQRSADDRIFKVEQASYFDVRKYNTRTEPLGRDALGNIYWCFQQKTKDASWGKLIFCEMLWPVEHYEQAQKTLQAEVEDTVKAGVKRRRKADKPEAKDASSQPALPTLQPAEQPAGEPAASGSSSAPPSVAAVPAPKPSLSTSAGKPVADAGKEEPRKRKRKRVAASPPTERTCYYVSGRANVYQLAAWVKAQPGHSNKKLVEELESLAYYWPE